MEDKSKDSLVSGDSIRQQFLDFYASRGHKILPSASLVPDDPTVLLTIAGMLPFKPIFLGKVMSKILNEFNLRFANISSQTCQKLRKNIHRLPFDSIIENYANYLCLFLIIVKRTLLLYNIVSYMFILHYDCNTTILLTVLKYCERLELPRAIYNCVFVA